MEPGRPKPALRWVALGDSITEDPSGYVSICARQLAKLGSSLPISVFNAGISGNKAKDMVARFHQDVLAHRPHLVTISVGVNDVWHGFYDFEREVRLPAYDPAKGEDLEHYKRDLQWMAGQLAEHAANLVFVSPTMIGEDRQSRENEMLVRYIEAMKSVAEEWRAQYCPMNEHVWKSLGELRKTEPSARFTTDGVHMNAKGASAMAAALLGTLGLPEGLQVEF